LAVWLLASAGFVTAQGADFTPVVVPQSDAGDAYRAVVGRRASTKITYVESYTGDLMGPKSAQKKRPQSREPLVAGQTGVLIIVGLCLLAIGLFFYFGGGGALLARGPKNFAAKDSQRGDWDVEPELDRAGIEALLRRLATSQDRGRALVQLSRYSLLRASDVTGVLFARSDTEREALRRLPDPWVAKTGIATLLQHTELAHYGGQDVDDGSFETCLMIATDILRGKGGKHA